MKIDLGLGEIWKTILNWCHNRRRERQNEDACRACLRSLHPDLMQVLRRFSDSHSRQLTLNTGLPYEPVRVLERLGKIRLITHQGPIFAIYEIDPLIYEILTSEL